MFDLAIEAKFGFDTKFSLPEEEVDDDSSPPTIVFSSDVNIISGS
jgi:hypothetical protein